MHREDPVNTAITLAALLMCTAVLAAYAVRVARSGRASHPRLGASPGSALLPGWLVEAFYWAMHAPARLFVRLGVSPDALTYLSLVLSASSLPLLAWGEFPAAAIVIIAGATLDAMDGMVARARGVASPAGAVLDSCVDRVADAAPFIGLAIFYRHDVVTLVLPLFAMVSSSMVSYARAKSDGLRLALPNGLMRRHERVVYLCGPLLVAPLAPTLPLTGDVPYPLALLGVVIIAVVGALAAVVLISRTRAALSGKAPRDRRAALPIEPATRKGDGRLPLEHRS
jgi:CDP-diacylglycerol--glycerol-3-phosphate 3-phosphatidyltransferase